MPLRKFRLLTTAGQITVQDEMPDTEESLQAAARQWMSQAVIVLTDARGKRIHVRASAIVAVVDGWD